MSIRSISSDYGNDILENEAGKKFKVPKTSHDVYHASQGLSSNSIWFEGKEAEGFYLAAGSSYIYPTNYPIREYQESIVRTALFKNTLVSLPTGLGKTFIAAVVMYNFYRWYPNGKVVFMAPTRPLVAQQIKACYNIMGLPLEDITEMTGNLNVQDRVALWKEKRVFFLTPQIMVNDIKSKSCPAKMVKCLVVDEAHRAVKDYAYCHVVSLLDEEQAVFRTLALSATPGNDISSVQQVIQNLRITSLEFRGEDALDVIKYTHQKSVESVVVSLSINIQRVKEDFLQIYDKYAKRLRDYKALNCNISTATKFQILKASEKFRAHPPRGASPSLVGSIIGDFTICMSLAHSLELLQIYGLRAFYSYLNEGGEKNKAAATRLKKDEDLGKILLRLKTILSKNPGEESYIWGHPKLYKLTSILTEHFKAAKECKENTKAIIFCQYRVVVNEVLDILTNLNTDIKPVMFIGQSSHSFKDKGMTQAKQMDIMKAFREGIYNCMVATSVAEEGLDIGEVDLIILMEAHKSPIRLVQRIGRTGRKRNGKCIVLVTEGREEYKFKEAMAARKSYVSNILNAKTVREKLYSVCPSMFPPGMKPVRQLLHIEVVEQPCSENVVATTKHQVDIRSCLVPEEISSITSDEYNEIRKEIGKSKLHFDLLPKKEFLFHRINDSKMPIDELLKKDYHFFSDWNDWNLQLHESHEISHVEDSEMLCGLLNRFYSFDINFFNINSSNLGKEIKRKAETKQLFNEGDEEEDLLSKKDKKSKKDINKKKFGMDIRHCMAAVVDKIKVTKEVDNNEIIDLDDLDINVNSTNSHCNDKLIDDIIQNLNKELKTNCKYLDSNKISKKYENSFVATIDTYNLTFKKKTCLFSLYSSLTDTVTDIVADISSELERLQMEAAIKKIDLENEMVHDIHSPVPIHDIKILKKESDRFVELDDLFDCEEEIESNHNVEYLNNETKILTTEKENLHSHKIEENEPVTPLSKGTGNYWDSLPNEYFDLENCFTPVVNHIASSTPKVSKSALPKTTSNHVNFCVSIDSPVKKISNDSFWNLDDLFENNGNTDLKNNKSSVSSLAENITEETMMGITQMVSIIEKEKLANHGSKLGTTNLDSPKNVGCISSGYKGKRYIEFEQGETKENHGASLDDEKKLLDEDDDLFTSVTDLDDIPIKIKTINDTYGLKNYSSDIFSTTVFQSKCLNNETIELLDSPTKSPMLKRIKIGSDNDLITSTKDDCEDKGSKHQLMVSCKNIDISTGNAKIDTSEKEYMDREHFDKSPNCKKSILKDSLLKCNLQLENEVISMQEKNYIDRFDKNISIDDNNKGLSSEAGGMEIIFKDTLKVEHAETVNRYNSINNPSNIIAKSPKVKSENQADNMNFKRFVSNKKKPLHSQSSEMNSVSNMKATHIISVMQNEKSVSDKNLPNKVKIQSAPELQELDEEWWFDFDFPNIPKVDQNKICQTENKSKQDLKHNIDYKNTNESNKIDLINSNHRPYTPLNKPETSGGEKKNAKELGESSSSLVSSITQPNEYICRNQDTDLHVSILNDKEIAPDHKRTAPPTKPLQNCSKWFLSNGSDDEIFTSDPVLNKEKACVNSKRSECKKKRKRKNCAFIENEAIVSDDDAGISSGGNDDSSGLEELDESFIDDEEQCNDSHAKYLQSVKSPIHGKFKIPNKINNIMDVYSQHENNDSEYMNDSFCVDSEGSSESDELCEIEIAEKILNKKRRMKKQTIKPKVKRRRIKIISPEVTNINEDLDVSPHTSYKTPERVGLAKKKRHFIIPSDSDASDNSPLTLNKRMNLKPI